MLVGCPTIVRADRGTENCNVAFIQPFLRENSNDTFKGENSFMYGKSTGDLMNNFNIAPYLTLLSIAH